MAHVGACLQAIGGSVRRSEVSIACKQAPTKRHANFGPSLLATFARVACKQTLLMADPRTEPDPYDPKPTLWQRHPHLAWILAVFGFTVFLTYISFPPVSTGEAAYVLA